MNKPIRVFYSDLDGRFYASSCYRTKLSPDGTSELVTITGVKYDVTQDIARVIVDKQIEFTPVNLNRRRTLPGSQRDLENKLAQAAQDEKEVGDGTAIR